MFKYYILLLICISLCGCHSIQKKSFKTKLDKNRIERCMLRERSNCNSKKEICKLYDKKDDKKCKSEFDECVKKSAVKCEI